MALVGAAAFFSPILTSLGSVLIMARIYSMRFSNAFSVASIAVWCVCECSMGVALLKMAHAIERKRGTGNATAPYTVTLLLVLWLVVSLAFVWRKFLHAMAVASLNIVLHFMVVGDVFTRAGLLAACMAVLGSLWAMWTCLFALSFTLYTRRRAMKPIGDAVMKHMRRDMLAESMNKHKADDKNGVV